MTVTIVDYGLGNLLSVRRALEACGAETQLADTARAVENAHLLLLPGVGAFGDGMRRLRGRGLCLPLQKQARRGVPLLGVCLGMQMLFEESDEFGPHEGLGLLKGRVLRLPDFDKDGAPQRVPHIGWKKLLPHGAASFQNSLFSSLRAEARMYFIHSYEAKPAFSADCLADVLYGGRAVCAAAGHGNVIGFQFHPEKSGPHGLGLLRVFLKACESGLL